MADTSGEIRKGGQVASAAKQAKQKTPGLLLTAEGLWRCNTCGRVTPTTPVCAGAHDDGSPRCGKAVCVHCADRCVRCQTPLCPDCYARSKEGALCVQCPQPAGGRAAYNSIRQRTRSWSPSGASTSNADWAAETERVNRASAEAQQSVDDAMRRADEIERAIKEMKERNRRNPPRM